MLPEAELDTLGEQYSKRICEGQALIAFCQRDEISSDQLQSILLVRELGLADAESLPDFTNRGEKYRLRRWAKHFNEVMQAGREGVPMDNIEFKLGIDFKTNSPVYISYRHYSILTWNQALKK
ncbi:MAG: hypothetical protein AABX33_08765 [Nanoarchaeota archaeon]